MAWEKDPWRLDRRRLARVAVTPEEVGLCGCWQVVAVRRERKELDPRAEPPSDEIGYYVTSLADGELNDEELLDVIRGHWSAIENVPLAQQGPLCLRLECLLVCGTNAA